jgi:translation initiation factor 2 beta subunit (eIF-2beta)/eIF-5
MKQDKDKDCLSFKGKYTQEQITVHFMDFVKTYVLCPSCDLPETQLFIQKDKGKPKGLTHTCEACGTLSLVKPKLSDKTFEFIEKNIK